MTSVETQGTGTVLAKNKPVTQNMIEQFLYREARYLDDREFEKWLQCYADDVVYWMPSWDDNDMLVEDPQRDISLIYYANKGGLQDRVFRIRTERSSATSLPEPRTSHNISNVEVIERRGDLVDVRFNWHTMYFRYNTVDPYYGTSFYTIDFSGNAPLIRRKTVVLKNDYIHHVVDIYPDRRRRVIPGADQHPAGLQGRGLRNVQGVLRVRRVRPRRLSRRRALFR